MAQSLAAILKHKGKSYMLADIPRDSLKLTKTEATIIEHRISGKSFSEVEGKDRQHFLDQIIVRTAANTGCDLPQTDFFADVVSGEMAAILTDFGYDCLTLREILYAIRLNVKPAEMKVPSGIELDSVIFSGHMFNTYFVSRVLSNYMTLRNILDRKMQNFIDGYA